MRATDICAFCHRLIVDGSEESGCPGPGPDWMTEDGDFGCDLAPETCKEGVGSHRTQEEVYAIYRIVALSDHAGWVWQKMRASLYGDFIAVAAVGDWHEAVPKGMVGVVAFRGGVRAGNVECGYFLVPADEYRNGSTEGFVIDPERHAEWPEGANA